MVIFHSYVSLPEGNQLNFGVKPGTRVLIHPSAAHASALSGAAHTLRLTWPQAEPKRTGNQPWSHHEPPKGPGQQDKMRVIDDDRWYLEGFSTDFRRHFPTFIDFFSSFHWSHPPGIRVDSPALNAPNLSLVIQKGGIPLNFNVNGENHGNTCPKHS